MTLLFQVLADDIHIKLQKLNVIELRRSSRTVQVEHIFVF